MSIHQVTTPESKEDFTPILLRMECSTNTPNLFLSRSTTKCVGPCFIRRQTLSFLLVTKPKSLVSDPTPSPPPFSLVDNGTTVELGRQGTVLVGSRSPSSLPTNGRVRPEERDCRRLPPTLLQSPGTGKWSYTDPDLPTHEVRRPFSLSGTSLQELLFSKI